MNWIRLNPYELRNQLATEQLDFTIEENRFKLGRVIYHIAERRGFRSSKGDSISSNTNETDGDLKSSELVSAEKITSYMTEHKLPTVGCALYQLIKENQRVRAEYKVIRQQYKDELRYIFEFQDGLSTDSDFFKRIISEKKNEGTIFYKRPLQSQKGNIGKCLLEPSKPRCPQSRPEFEIFCAWGFINNIRIGDECSEELPLNIKQCMFDEVFVKANDFKFETIRNWLEKKTGRKFNWSQDKRYKTINFRDNTPVPAATVIYRFKQLLSDEWQTWTCTPDKMHSNYGTDRGTHAVNYNWEDVWHICFTADDEEPLRLYADQSGLDYKLLLKLWKDMTVAYSNLSLKAIKNINRFLMKGLIYNEACLLAKLPDLFKDKWNGEIEDILTKALTSIIDQNTRSRRIVKIVNNLIEEYKGIPYENMFAYKDYSYTLQKTDYEDIRRKAENHYGNMTWAKMSAEEQNKIIFEVGRLYQDFFADKDRKYISFRRVSDDINQFLSDNFEELSAKQLDKLYHHSNVQIYPAVKEQRIIKGDKILLRKLLDTPELASLRNPMALRVLHTLRRKINDLIIDGIIDEETRVVVEIARELNDANKRWAIKTFQDKHNAQNDIYRDALKDLCDNSDTVLKARLLVEQHECCINGDEGWKNDKKLTEKKEAVFEKYMDALTKKYRLWIEQGGTCLYTGKVIRISDLLNGDRFDIEHTMPISKSFDDSLSNKTLCESYFNRNIKGNRLPSELDNETYEKILIRIQPWKDRVEELKSNVIFWRNNSKKAQTKEQKDKAIRQRLLWEMELEYWQKKINTFTVKEINTGFKNSQLVDTSIIAKYAHLYLKTVFNKVDVQKGEVTSKFRKILGIQDDDQLKNRDYNYHHAIDAMVLTFVPVANRRDSLLALYYERQEAKNGIGIDRPLKKIEEEMKTLLKAYGLSVDFSKAIKTIQTNVLSINESRSQALTPTSRRQRIRGKVIPIRDVQGNIVFEKDENGEFRLDKYGHRIPMAKQWIKGDCVRGNLHDQTYYGAITQNGDGTIRYVVRTKLKYKASAMDSGFKTWEDIEKVIVNKDLVPMMKSQFPKGTSFKDAIESEEGIWMLKYDNGKVLKFNKIRHIRCIATNITNPIKVRQQTFKSDKEYKNFYYCRNGENIAYALYDSGKKRTFEVISLFEAARISNSQNIHNIVDVFPDVIYKEEGTKKKNETVEYKKLFALIPGQMVILKGEEEKVSELSIEDISKRLYVLKRIFDPNQGLLQLQYHLEARDNKALEMAYPKDNYGKSGINGFSSIDLVTPFPRLLLSIGKQNFWVEGLDFEFHNGIVVAK